uniref:Uncharacterized protein n=2 Tax=Rhodnius TaxID=13248 RepID=T1IFD7_RHOPR
MKKLWMSLNLIIILLLISSSVIGQEQKSGPVKEVKEKVVKRRYGVFNQLHIIDVPTKPCPENERRDIFGKCRPIFN